MDSWKVIYDGYNPDHEPLREALCTLGNGYFATRGAAEESRDDDIHYPGTYLAGGYNRLTSDVSGERIENEDFVNWPNWLMLSIKSEDGEWLNLDQVELLDYQQVLNLKQGCLERNFSFLEPSGKKTRIKSTRIVLMNDPHIAAINWEITPLNWSGKCTVKTALDGTVINNNVARYSDLRSDHLEPISESTVDEESIGLEVQTCQSRIRMAQVAKTTAHQDSHKLNPERKTNSHKGYIEQLFSLELTENTTVNVCKKVTLFTSRDRAISEPAFQAKQRIDEVPDFQELLDQQAISWEELWYRSDIQIENNQEDQLVLRLHIFHLLQTASMNNIDLDVGIPSRGLHGEAYRGHILWDELFIFPLLNFSIPEVTRELIMYRYRRLDEARRMASEAGFSGAMFPWQSGSDGREESQQIHLNPKSGRWIPDNTFLQRHVNAAIAYNIWHYYEVSGDIEFMYFYGTEMMLEIAKFWVSKIEYNQQKERYEINEVVGPDEYHTRYPDAAEPGIDNNAYTNLMVVWVLIRAIESLDLLDQDASARLMKNLHITREDLDLWQGITHKMFIPIDEDGLIQQFEGYQMLEELDWDHYHEEYGEILRLDRIMESENDNVNRYKASKQADVLMIFYLLSTKEICDIMTRLGYQFNDEAKKRNIDYYEKRTSHGSTLSKLVHSWVMAQSNRQRSWHNFQKALMSDFKDIQGGTTPEGIHLGAMAGTVDLMQRCYIGIEVMTSALRFTPLLPQELKRIRTRFRYRGHWMKIDLDHQKLKIVSDGGWGPAIKIHFDHESRMLNHGDTIEWKINKQW